MHEILIRKGEDGQLGFFDAAKRLEALSAKDDPLQALDRQFQQASPQAALAHRERLQQRLFHGCLGFCVILGSATGASLGLRTLRWEEPEG